MNIRTAVNRSAMSIVLLALPAGHSLSYAAGASPAAGSPVATTEAEIPQAWPEAAGVDSAPLLRMSEWIRNEKLDVRSMLLIKDGKLIFERYGAGLSRDYNYELYSVTKTVTSLLAGILVGEKKLSVDQKIAPLLAAAHPEFNDALADKQSIELRHLISMSSGLHYKTSEGTDPLYYLTPNRLKREHANLWGLVPACVSFGLTRRG